MTLSIIGAGFGRTGTTSQKAALDELGLGPCYHFDEILKNPGHDQLWLDVVGGKQIDWRALFKDYQATVDWPGCYYWQELAAEFPDAKVLLSTRDFDSWYDSTTKTLYRTMKTDYSKAPQGQYNVLEMSCIMILEDTFHGRFEDKTYAKEIYQQHHDKIIKSVDPDRLLVYQISEGWAPLSAFFGKPVPDAPFPNANSLSEYLATWF